ncbi:putative toxin [Pseudomonas viridiflava]|uniref:putative toxin n=1 Tax=Pseudomonas viridiflava TaxID=33069 RepID=UPI0020BFA522|nr:putative toxin [Pseudomonas viridiflava]
MPLSKIEPIVGKSESAPQVVVNSKSGNEFERLVIKEFDHVGGTKNVEAITVQLPNGTAVTTIPDMLGRTAGGLVEIKNVINLSNSNQLRAQLQLAESTGQPFTLIVSPRTQTISGPLRSRIDAVVSKNGGGIYKFDPSTKIFSEY